MSIVISPDTAVTMLDSTWNSFQALFRLYQLATLMEGAIILLLVVYLGKNNWRPIGQKIFNGLMVTNRAIDQMRENPDARKELSVFSIGKFWAFVFSGLFAFLALMSVFIMGYFAAVGEGIATNNATEAVQVTASNHLLWQLDFVQDFLWAIFVISLLVIFRDYIALFWNVMLERRIIRKPQVIIPNWVYRGLRYSILILFTVFSFLAIYNLCLIATPSMAGSTALTETVGQTITNQLAQGWCNLAGIYIPISFIFVVYWICSVWLMAFGYLLKYELDYLWSLVKRIPRWLLKQRV